MRIMAQRTEYNVYEEKKRIKTYLQLAMQLAVIKSRSARAENAFLMRSESGVFKLLFHFIEYLRS